MLKGYSKTVEEIYSILDSQFEGLSITEAEKRLNQYGLNVISSERSINPLTIFFKQFKDLLVIILLIAGIITGIIGILQSNRESIIDVSAIGIVILLNAFLGFYQEFSAEKSISALKKLSESEVIVARDHVKQRINSEQLVPGDIIFLEAGNRITADIRLIQSYEIRTNESILTGESTTVRKRTAVLPEETPLADRNNMLYNGTTTVNGSGMGIVVNTGSSTELGKIATSLQDIEREETPIQKKLDNLAKQLTLVIVILSVIIFLIGLFTIGLNMWTTLLIFAIGLAVAAVPEGLPTVLTLSLALGINRMAKKHALIRKLPAVEVLGSTTVICTDKTGTLTRNEQTVKLVWTIDEKYNVTGNGYYNNGKIVVKKSAEQSEPEANISLQKSIEIGALANEASIEFQGENKPYKIFGDPTEIALLILAEKGSSLDKIKKKSSVEYLFPFDSDRKRMSAIVKNNETGDYQILVKGALDILLDLCNYQFSKNKVHSLSEEQKQKLLTISENYSANYAYRVLGLAFRDISPKEAEKLILSEDYECVETDLTFVGFVGMIDPPREETQLAINSARNAGIQVIMITGDHVETAKAIGRSINLCMETKPITGNQLDKMTDEELEQAVLTTKIFARVSPDHKLRIVNALKKHGEIVTMTGDGVNDSPALKRADIGVAMGIAGTDVAKEASEMILVDDNFSTIIDAISEGRTIYNNIKKFVGYLLSANAGEIFTVLFGVLFGLIFFRTSIIPILTIQLLYINLVTDTFPALALGMTQPEKDVMLRKPRDPNEPIIDNRMIAMILLTGLSYAIGTILVYFWSMDFSLSTDHQAIATAETMVFVSLVIYQLLHSLSVSQNELIFSRRFFNNTKLFGAVGISLVLLIIAVYVPFISDFIDTNPLELRHWGMILATAIPIFLMDEFRKFIFYRDKQNPVHKEGATC
ncbi:MAG: HAD-IC family P-type ATPase [Candidatus Heimdallarchaeota archaeon]|nr:HAD-IC family P-type ATPase [Candidatus Heimdallarchaeota archaeon]